MFIIIFINLLQQLFYYFILFLFLFFHLSTGLYIALFIFIFVITSIIINSIFLLVLFLIYISYASNARATCVIIPYKDGLKAPIRLLGKGRFCLAFAR